eukprot:3140939-Pleurochrysis_carterae.AAC.5
MAQSGCFGGASGNCTGLLRAAQGRSQTSAASQGWTVAVLNQGSSILNPCSSWIFSQAGGSFAFIA